MMRRIRMKIDVNANVLNVSNKEQRVQESVRENNNGIFSADKVVFHSGMEQIVVEKASGDKEKATEQGRQDSSELKDTMKQLADLFNTVTEKDLEELKKEGEDAEEEPLEVIVTEVDKIKVKLATYCDDYDPVISDLSSEQLQKLAGSVPNAIHIADKLIRSQLPVTPEHILKTQNALDMAKGTEPLSDSAKVYMIQNNEELTIQNLYTAEYSSTDAVSCPPADSQGYYEDRVEGYYVRTANHPELGKLHDQMVSVISRAGLTINDQTMGQAGWLLEHQIPLNEQTINKLNQIENLEFPIDTEVTLDNIMQAIQEGKQPVQAYISLQEDMVVRCQQAIQVIQDTTDGQLKKVLMEQPAVTIEALKNEQKSTVHQEPTAAQLIAEDDIAFVTARRQLEEIRLQMTLEASVTMVRNGIDIETQSIQNLIEDLKTVEESYYKNLLHAGNAEPTDENAALLKEITESVKSIATAPVQIIGSVAFQESKQTVSAIHQEAVVAAEKFKMAETAYETVMTKPRPDMGDSIQKAFRNVDAIIEDMNLEPTEANKRAIRILGYNAIEITKENLLKVKAVDQQVNQMLKAMAPSKVLEMIREGYNPLNQTVEEVNQKLSDMARDSVAQEEKYSEFLYKMENNKEISAEEREAYIGIYRLMHQVEKSDGAVIGALVMQGSEITMKNLMTAIRSKKHTAMDYQVGEDMGVTESASGNNLSITNQIEKGFADYYQSLASKALQEMSPENLLNIINTQDMMDMSLERFVEAATAEVSDKESDRKYMEEKLSRIQESTKAESEVIKMLKDYGQPVSPNNLLAAKELLYSTGNLFKKLMAQSGKEKTLRDSLLRNVEELEESFLDEDSVQEAYNTFTKTAKAVVESGTLEENITYEQMKEWKLLHSQIRLAENFSKQQNYYIPVQVGDKLAPVRLSFQHSKGEPKVTITTQTEETGKIGAEFSVQEKGLNAYFACDTINGKEFLQNIQDQLKRFIESDTGIQMDKAVYVQYEELDLNRFSDRENKDIKNNASSKELYQIAKVFLKALHNE